MPNVLLGAEISMRNGGAQGDYQAGVSQGFHRACFGGPHHASLGRGDCPAFAERGCLTRGGR
jgi:hypothetical protein